MLAPASRKPERAARWQSEPIVRRWGSQGAYSDLDRVPRLRGGSRKNWLFSGTPAGASASAAIYSLFKTAKANGLEPSRYLRYLFEQVPLAAATANYRALLPQHLPAPEVTRLVQGTTGGSLGAYLDSEGLSDTGRDALNIVPRHRGSRRQT